jgi:hypothetical protein
MIRRVQYRRFTKQGKQGFRTYIPEWVILCLGLDPTQPVDIVYAWDDVRPDEVLIRAATVHEQFIQANHEEELTQEYLRGEHETPEWKAIDEDFLEHEAMMGNTHQDRPRTTRSPLKPREQGWFDKLEGEFTLQTLLDMGCPVGLHQRLIKRALQYGLILKNREERLGPGRPRIWYVKNEVFKGKGEEDVEVVEKVKT